MKQTGELLKNARESAKLSLSEVALSTKINPKILAAIENGDSSNLPAKTFLKGFIRSYALYLKLDADEVVKLFQSETGGAPPAPQTIPDGPRTPSEPSATPAPKQRRVGDDESFSGLRAIAVTVIVVLIGLIIGVRELIEKYQREKVIEASTELKVSPLANDEPKKAEPPPQPEKAAEPPKVLEKLSEIKASPMVEPKKEEAKIAETKKEEPQKPEVKVEAKIEPVKVVEVKKEEPKKEPPKKEEPKPAPTDVKAETILKSAKNEIILEALDKVEVKFRVHGEAKMLSLGPTEVHTIFADEPMVLDLSDGGAVNIILNGRERGVPGDLGKPKQVKIP